MDKELLKELISVCGSKKIAKEVAMKLKKKGDLNILLPEWLDAYEKARGDDIVRIEKAFEPILLKTKTPMGSGKMHIIDTEGKAKKLKIKKFPNLDNVIIYPCFNFGDIIESLHKIMKVAIPLGKDDDKQIIKVFGETSSGKTHFILDIADKIRESNEDWIAVDSLGKAWDWAQDEYVERVYGKDIGDILIEIKRRNIEAGKQKKPVSLDGLRDYPTIKTRHNRDFIDLITNKLRFNFIATAQPKQIIEFKDKNDSEVAKEISRVFGELGYKPAGEKFNLFRFDTILLLERFLDCYTCDKCGKTFNRRIRVCSKCDSREFTSKYTFYVEAFKNLGKKEFGRKLIEESGYNVYLKNS